MKLIAAQLTNETFRLLNLNRHNYKNGAKLSPALECPSQHFVTFTLYLCNYCNYCRVGVESRSKNIVVFLFFKVQFFSYSQYEKRLRWPTQGAGYVHLTTEPRSGQGQLDYHWDPECTCDRLGPSTELWFFSKRILYFILHYLYINRRSFVDNVKREEETSKSLLSFYSLTRKCSPSFFILSIRTRALFLTNILKSLDENQKEIIALFYITCSLEEQNHFYFTVFKWSPCPCGGWRHNACHRFLFV